MSSNSRSREQIVLLGLPNAPRGAAREPSVEARGAAREPNKHAVESGDSRSRREDPNATLLEVPTALAQAAAQAARTAPPPLPPDVEAEMLAKRRFVLDGAAMLDGVSVSSTASVRALRQMPVAAEDAPTLRMARPRIERIMDVVGSAESSVQPKPTTPSRERTLKGMLVVPQVAADGSVQLGLPSEQRHTEQLSVHALEAALRQVTLGDQQPTKEMSLADMLAEAASLAELGRGIPVSTGASVARTDLPPSEAVPAPTREPSQTMKLRIDEQDEQVSAPKRANKWRTVGLTVAVVLAAGAAMPSSWGGTTIQHWLAAPSLLQAVSMIALGQPAAPQAAGEAGAKEKSPAVSSASAVPAADPAKASPAASAVAAPLVADEPVVPQRVAEPTEHAAETVVQEAASQPSARTSDSSTKAIQSARPEIASALYLDGRYKDALAEYRALAAEHPDQPVYAQFARILRRRIVETCTLMQPQKAAQCEQL